MDTMGDREFVTKLKSYLINRGYESNPQLERALLTLTEFLPPGHFKWLAGGSVGLWLQGTALAAPPRDIDLYAEEKAAVLIHECLERFAIDEPYWDRCGIYVSLLSHYKIEDYIIELVGGFEVHAELGSYKVEVEGLLEQYAAEIIPGLKVMPLAHEYLFNLLRNRPDRYKAIADQINQAPEKHVLLLKQIIERNNWSQAQKIAMDKLSPLKGW